MRLEQLLLRTAQDIRDRLEAKDPGADPALLDRLTYIRGTLRAERIEKLEPQEEAGR